MNANEGEAHHIGERLSLKRQACTVRYIGPVGNKAGTWLGVEWDDPKRGKHDGTFDGVNYFACRSKAPSAASFIKPSQPWDQPRSFLSALREKYMPALHKDEAEVVYISGKQAEEIGFDKFSQRQARLQGIHVLVLDHMRITAMLTDGSEEKLIRELCVDITELDLSGNLFEKFGEILRLCDMLPKLRTLTLDGNRINVSGLDQGATSSLYPPITTLKTLSLSNTLLEPGEADQILSVLPNLESFNFADNGIAGPFHLRLPPRVSTLDLSDNQLTALSDLRSLSSHCPSTLILKRNRIRIVNYHASTGFTLPISELDVTHNSIDSFTFFNALTPQTFPNLIHLRVTGNPLYKDLLSAEGKPLTTEDGYMLTLARLPQLHYLNYAKVTDKERLNAETYYLNQIAQEISRAPEGKEREITSRHPRYRELCEEYGEPLLTRHSQKDQVNPNSLAARLLSINFTLAPHTLPDVRERTWSEEVPKSFSIYALLGLVGKKLHVMPLRLRLVLESNERDPLGREGMYAGPEWWDSSDEEEGAGLGDGEDEEERWVRREVEMGAGTRAVGTFVEGMVATVRVEHEGG